MQVLCRSASSVGMYDQIMDILVPRVFSRVNESLLVAYGMAPIIRFLLLFGPSTDGQQNLSNWEAAMYG